MNLKALLKDTAIYGLSSIVGRFLNYLLVPLYTIKIAAETGGYGVVTNLYAYTALCLAVLTFGMETTLFRFSSKDGEDADVVYGTALKMVGTVALLFAALIFIFISPVSSALGYGAHPEYVRTMALIVALDAFQAIMFSRLRQQGRAVKFAALKLSFIIPNVLLNLVVFLGLPSWTGRQYEVGDIFTVNLICTAGVTFGFIKEIIIGLKARFDGALCRRMLRYTWPLLILSLVGMLGQAADKIIFPWLVPGTEGQVQLGIYGACVKLAMIMSLLTQAFRYAYEPIVFNGSRDKNSPQTLADGMKYFIMFTLLAFLAVVVYMPVLKHFVGQSYWVGLGVVPVVMLGEIFMGVYFNLSFWYKLSDRTWWGAVLSGIGAVVMIATNLILVPRVGYWGCAWGCFAGYLAAMVASWAAGRRTMKIPYEYGTIAALTGLTGAIWALYEFVPVGGTVLKLAFGTALIGLYCAAAWKIGYKRTQTNNYD